MIGLRLERDREDSCFLTHPESLDVRITWSSTRVTCFMPVALVGLLIMLPFTPEVRLLRQGMIRSL